MVIKPFLRTKAVIISRLNKHSQRVSHDSNLKLAALCKEGLLKEALHILLTSHKQTINSFTYLQLLQTCISKNALSEGRKIHAHINEREIKISGHKLLQDTLIRMYDRFGSLVDAREVFDKMTERDILSWNAIIAAYRRKGYPEEALTLFRQMQTAGVEADQFTFSSILQACAKIRALEQGMCIHQRVIGRGVLSDVVVASALIDMYTKCGSLDMARQLFDKMSQRDVISWNAMIAGYAQNSVLDKALKLFKEMPQRDTFSWNVMIAGYAQNGDLNQALKIFKEMPRPDIVSWNAMIAGYTQNGFAEKALDAFNDMQMAGIKPDATTFASVLPACAKMGALKQGMYIHQTVVENGFLLNVIVASALVDMYAKCGSIQKAHELFNKMPQKNVVSWSAIIAGYAQNGFCKAAIKLFELMRQSGTYPNHVSFACVLLACSHAGLVDEGCKYFNGMTDFYCITPTTDHYVCMADLLARAGYLEQTLNFIIKMPIKPVVVVWVSLLGACRTHKNVQLGVFTATVLFELDPKNSATFVLLSNIYAEVGRWGEVGMVRRLMKDREIKKIPGCSWIEGHKMVHAFCAGDRSHPQTQEIYAMLEKLSLEIKVAGGFPDSAQEVNDVEKEEKELFLGHHSEKLAIAFGLLNTPHGTTIRIVKNLRVCVDCHTTIKFISKIVARQIIVRDANRFHHFKQGLCSCRDYW